MDGTEMFLASQLFDCFDTTRNNVAGRLPVGPGSAGFRQFEETCRIATLSFVSLYLAMRDGSPSGLWPAGGATCDPQLSLMT
jgi:hypothetical protein